MRQLIETRALRLLGVCRTSQRNVTQGDSRDVESTLRNRERERETSLTRRFDFINATINSEREQTDKNSHRLSKHFKTFFFSNLYDRF